MTATGMSSWPPATLSVGRDDDDGAVGHPGTGVRDRSECAVPKPLDAVATHHEQVADPRLSHQYVSRFALHDPVGDGYVGGSLDPLHRHPGSLLRRPLGIREIRVIPLRGEPGEGSHELDRTPAPSGLGQRPHVCASAAGRSVSCHLDDPVACHALILRSKPSRHEGTVSGRSGPWSRVRRICPSRDQRPLSPGPHSSRTPAGQRENLDIREGRCLMSSDQETGPSPT